MRHLLPCLIAMLVGVTPMSFTAEAAPEQFTLADGRVLIGTYDAKAGVLSIVGKIKGAVPVKPDDIVSRKPAPLEPAKNKDADGGGGEGEVAEKKKRPVAAPADPKAILIEQQSTWIARKTIELRSFDSKIERTRRKIVDFRKQFHERAKSEDGWYDPERVAERFLEERTETLPRSQQSNTAVRGLVDECKELIAKREALDKELVNARTALAELEGKPAPAAPAK